MVEPSRWKKHFHLAGADKEGAEAVLIALYGAGMPPAAW
jgi:hypothetical protein